MSVRSAAAIVLAVCAMGVLSAQQQPPPPLTPPAIRIPDPVPEETAEQREARRMANEYVSGDADAAVAYFAGRKTYELPPLVALTTAPAPGTEPPPRASSAGYLVQPLFSTEIGMRLRTFGKIADSAGLESASGVVGLNGLFEVKSFATYRFLDDLLHHARDEVVPREAQWRPRPDVTVQSAPEVPASQRPSVERFVRDWHVVAISHCVRWRLVCADTLLKSAQAGFAGAADVLVVSAALAEARGDGTKALALARRAVAAEPKNVSALLRLGRLLAAAGRTSEARTTLEGALAGATEERRDAARYFALTALADLDAGAGRTTSARTRRAEASAIKAFAHPVFAGLQPAEIYRAGLFYEQPKRIQALRALMRAGPE